MTPENEMNEELHQLLDSLEEHGKNVRRQKELSDLIDRLAGEEKLMVIHRKRRKLVPIWLAMGAAAAVIMLLLLLKPNVNENPNLNKEIITEVTETVDSVMVEVEKLLAENTPVVTQKTQVKKEKTRSEVVEKVEEQPVLDEIIPSEILDSVSVETNNIISENETPLAVQKPQRRVIRSLNLVCYECQNEPDNYQIQTVNSKSDKTLFGQPQDPNMKDGTLMAFEVKLN